MKCHPRIILVLSLVGIILSSETGCKKAMNPVGPDGSGGQTGTPVSPAARQGALGSVHQLYETVDWTNPSAAKQTLLQLLRSRPEFEASDTNTGSSLWARFTDGRLLIIAQDRESDTSSPIPTGILHLPNTLAIAGGELPVNHTASVLNAMGTAFRNPTPLLGAMLAAKGYTLSPGSPTVATLAAIKNVGVFYLDSHGGQGTLRDGTQQYAVWTSSPVDTTTDASLKQMWDGHELAYFEADADRIAGPGGGKTSETRFAITKNFVLLEMEFGQNSLVYFDCCGSLNVDFRNACIAVSSGGSAAYAGWSYDSPDKASTRTAYFVLDRLLGTNMDPFYKEDPPQRPFRYPEILKELASNNLDTYHWSNGLVSVFGIVPSGASFGMLAPSIEHLTVDERNKRLYVFGEFGSDGASATVTINNQPMPITRWSIGEIWCTIPTSGSNTSGDVKVIVHGDTSNAVRLTEWKGQVQVTATIDGSLGYSVTYAFHIRGDVHSFRQNPGETPKPEQVEGTDGMGDSFAQVSVGGTMQDNTSPGGGCTQYLTETWPQAQKQITLPSTGLTNLLIGGDLHPQAQGLTLYLAVGATGLLTDNITDSMVCPNSQPQVAHFSNPAPFEESDTLYLSFDDKFNLIGMPTFTRLPRNGPGVFEFDPSISLGTATVTFGGASAINPPDPKAGQRPQARRYDPPGRR